MHTCSVAQLFLSLSFLPPSFSVVHRIGLSDRDEMAAGAVMLMATLLYSLTIVCSISLAAEQTAANNDLCGGGGAGAPTAAC